MTIILLAVTLASVAVSCALLAVVVRQSREQRLRSDARTAALAEAISLAAAPSIGTAPVAGGLAPGATPLTTGGDRLALLAIDPIAGDAFRTELHDLPAGPGTEAAMFAGDSVRGRPAWHALMVPLVGVLVVGLASATIVALHHRETPPAAATGAVAPLELITLGAQRNGPALTISGVVRNSREGQAKKDMAARISLFDRQGTLVSSTVVALDYPRLQPGDESPFSMSATQAADIARYRVSFSSGSVTVPHVDRRGTSGTAVQSVSAR